VLYCPKFETMDWYVTIGHDWQADPPLYAVWKYPKFGKSEIVFIGTREECLNKQDELSRT
jgi:hypothetical protein